MKQILLTCACLMAFTYANADYDPNYVYKFDCAFAGSFYGVPLAKPLGGSEISYMPADVNGSFCTVYPNTVMSIGGFSSSSCTGYSLTKTEFKASACARAN